MKPYILIVEDESVLYEGLYDLLNDNYFTPSEYIKSYDEAIAEIEKKRPDLVLLDINLQGEKDGLDLGKVLNEKYKIPFIYLTELDDERFFQEGLKTNHEHYIVKAKPVLDKDLLLRSIRTCLNKVNSACEKDCLMVYVDYIEKIKEYGVNGISQIPLKYNDIILFTTKALPNNAEKIVNIKKNYCQVLAESGDKYLVKLSLKDVLNNAPYYFVRISESEVINILPECFDGRINGSKIQIYGLEYKISETYLSEFNKRIATFYNLPKKSSINPKK